MTSEIYSRPPYSNLQNTATRKLKNTFNKTQTISIPNTHNLDSNQPQKYNPYADLQEHEGPDHEYQTQSSTKQSNY